MVKKCLVCGKEFHICQSIASKRFTCSRGCAAERLRGFKHTGRKSVIGSNKIYAGHDLTGLRFGKLTVIGTGEQRDHRSNRLWLAKCDCGNTVVVAATTLVNKHKTHCGCVRYVSNLSRAWRGNGDVSGGYWSSLRNSASKRHIAFEISVEYGYNLFLSQNRKCALSGLPLSFGDPSLPRSERKKDQTASLDRIDSTLGYVEGNVQWVHKRVNAMKMDMDEKDFIEMCRLIVESSHG